MRFVNIMFFALAMAALSAPAAVADDRVSPPLQGYRVGACTNWMFNSGGNMPGYLCSSYPVTVTVADAYSYSEMIRALEARIVELEKKVAELEKPKP